MSRQGYGAKHALVRETLLVRDPDSGPPVVDYSAMSRDELVDHFIDDRGLARFIDTQQAGIPRAEWDWRKIARDLMAFSRYLQFSPQYCEDLYDMQKGSA